MILEIEKSISSTMDVMKLFRFFITIAIFESIAAKQLRSLQGTDCSELTLHETTLSLNFHGDPDALTDEDKAEIAEILEESYEGVTSDPCFDIVHVEDSDDTARRRELSRTEMHGINNRKLADGQVEFDFTFIFYVLYQCNGCPDDSIYDNDGSRRRFLKNVEEKRPTRSVFNTEFNKILKKSSLSLKVDSLNRVSEEKQIGECSSKTKGLKTDMSITFKGDFGSVLNDKAELKHIELAVMKAYNTMNQANPFTCDTSFRKIRQAKYHRLTLIDENMFQMTFKTRYECRGCENGVLFDDIVSTFDAEREELYSDFRLSGPQEPKCSCDIYAEVKRAPTKDEFSRALRKVIEIRTEQGVISSVTDVTKVINSNDEFQI